MALNISLHLAKVWQCGAIVFSLADIKHHFVGKYHSSVGVTWLAGCRTRGSVGPAKGSRGLVATVSPPSYSPWGLAPGRGAIVHS